MGFVLQIVDGILGKYQIADNPAFSPCPRMFSSDLFLKVVKKWGSFVKI
jgi:hypothetical protein